MKTLRNPITTLVFLTLLLAVVSSQRHQAAAQEAPQDRQKGGTSLFPEDARVYPPRQPAAVLLTVLSSTGTAELMDSPAKSADRAAHPQGTQPY
ncbi:MAG: hypothetical protein AAFX56_11945 [Pseudomonadota bacterium]